jgi:hypothetical protein
VACPFGLFIAASLVGVEFARRSIGRNRVRTAATLLIAALLALLAALGLDTLALLRTGLRPTHSSYTALVYTNAAFNAQLVAALTIIVPYAAVRIFAGRLTAVRRVTSDCLWLLWLYSSTGSAVQPASSSTSSTVSAKQARHSGHWETTGSAQGRLLSTLLAAIAEFERELIR